MHVRKVTPLVSTAPGINAIYIMFFLPTGRTVGRIDLNWSADGTELTYNEVITYTYDQESSSPDVDEDTPITTINAPMVVSGTRGGRCSERGWQR